MFMNNICVFVYVCKYVGHSSHEGQKWVPGIELRFSGLYSKCFYTQSCSRGQTLTDKG